MCNYPSLWVMFVTTPLQPFSPTLFFFFPTELTLRRTPRLLTMLPWSENMWIYLKGNDLLRSALLDRFLPCFLACFCVFFSVKHHYFLPFLNLQECLLWLFILKSWFHNFNRLSTHTEWERQRHRESWTISAQCGLLNLCWRNDWNEWCTFPLFDEHVRVLYDWWI